MNQAKPKNIALSLFLMMMLLLNGSPALAKSAGNFALKDQFGKEIAVRFPSDKAVVLVFGDREGSEQVEGWVRPLYNQFTDRIYIFGIADLSAVPWAARPVVRRIIKSKSKTPVMLDWSGSVAKSYGCVKGKANVFVISKRGEVIAVKQGAASSGELNDLYQKVKSAL